ncbi:MAG TPA: PDZ domain-containing protein [Planctomycetota bacterium]|nr:PDZ domain-containing protein [Planctomycetota bacterium]
MFAAPCVALAAVALVPQDSLDHPHASARVAVRVPAQSTPQDFGDASTWRERFESKDLGARETDFEDLVSRAAQSDEARASLETWSKDEDHLEFAWTCRLALREAKARAARMDPLGGVDDRFEELRRRMFGNQPGDDRFDNFLLLDPFSNFQMGHFQGGGPLSIDPFQSLPGGAGVRSESEGFSLEMGPDGVKTHVKKNVDGEIKDEEYTAKSLDELLAAHPELSGHVNGGMALRLGRPGFLLDGGARLGLRTDKLGVYVPAQAEPGTSGLRIERVQPGSLATELGLEAGQTLVTINGRGVATRDDISKALAERDPDAALEVEVRDADGNTSTKTWKPDASRRGSGRPLEPRSLTGGVRKI